MGFQDFLLQIQRTGHIRIADAQKTPIAEVAGCTALFERHSTRCLLDLPGTPMSGDSGARTPIVRVVAMHWASLTIYAAAQFLVHREVEAEVIHEALSVACPLPADPDVCFSVDLYFRYLPDLIALSRGIAEKDPLVQRLMELAQRWPLSSVGVAGLKPAEPAALNAFLGHPGLAQLYIDRIIESADASRLCDPRVRALLAQSVGHHASLAGVLAGASTETSLAPVPIASEESSRK